MRALWKGLIALGQLGIPVRLYSATQRTLPTLHVVHETDNSPVERVLFCAREGKQISHDQTIRAAEVNGAYITITNRELESTIDRPAKSIAVQQFCNLADIPPQYFEKPYYAVPARGGERAYALLRDALVRSDKVALAQFMIHGADHIGMLAPARDILMLHQLRFATDIVPRSSLKTPQLPRSNPNELEVLCSVIDRFAGPVFIEDYHDEHAEALAALIDRKARGLKPARPERIEAHATPEADIIPTLERTLDNQATLHD